RRRLPRYSSLIIISEIAPLPRLDKVSPGKRVKDILWWCLPLVIIFLGALPQIRTRRLTRRRRQITRQHPSLGGIIVLPRYLDIIIRNLRIDKIPFELLPRRPRRNDRRRQILRIDHHQLDETDLVAF